MKKTYIAEKPKLGKAIADVLAKNSPKIESGKEFVAGKDWAVCWAAGHIYSLAEPDFYIADKFPGGTKGKSGRYAWSFEHLPILPGLDGWPDFAMVLDKEKAGLYKAIKKWVSWADVVVHAGDPDREGQLLVDEILDEIGNKKPVMRVLISAFDTVTVTRGLNSARHNSEFLGLSQAGRARSQADWLCGMNFSRAATLQARASGYAGPYVPIGRVQTALLGLIVCQDRQIESFKPVDYFSLLAKMNTLGPNSTGFTARWKPHAGQAGLDEEGRLLDRRVAEQLNVAVAGKTGVVVEYSDQEKQEPPPLPFSIEKLQILASKKYGFTSDTVLQALQTLYQTHELTTYPRSDKSHLPVSQWDDGKAIVAAITHNICPDAGVLDLIDTKLKSRAWNDEKSTPHHGIIPTRKKADLSALPVVERALYEEISKRYLAQFMPARRYRAVSASIDVTGQRFTATGTTTLSLGWKTLYCGKTDEPEDGSRQDADMLLPPMKQGDPIHCAGLTIESRQTTPPKHFTDGTLLEAMVNIHKYVTDEPVKAIFMAMLAKNKGSGDEPAEGACGLGTPATRHTFVPKLEEVCFVERVATKGKSKEKSIISTPSGRAFIDAIPAEIGKPDMTALWESAMSEIEAGRASLDRFIGMQANWIRQMVGLIRSKPLELPDPAVSGKTAKTNGRGAFAKAGSAFGSAAESAGKDCQKCGKPMVKRKGVKGPFYGCSGFPGCKHLENIPA